MLGDFFKKEKISQVDSLIDVVMEDMAANSTSSEEYTKLLTNLERLHELKAKDRREPVSRDTLVVVGGNLLLGLIIVGYERGNIITTKAISLLRMR